jgi:branched-chain amino acid transport system permease protein
MDEITLGSQIVQYVFTGLTIGAIYALVALGFNIIYNVTEVINFAQGEFAVWGGLSVVLLLQSFHLPLFFCFFLGVAVVALIGGAVYWLTIRPLQKPTILTMIMVTIAVSILLKGVAMFIWGKDPYALRPFTHSPPISFLGAYIQPQTFWVLGITVAFVLILSYFYQHTILGKAMRACADNPLASGLVGISTKKMILVSFALSAALGAVGGAIITPMTLMEYDRGAMLALKGFGAAILGGLGNFYGAVLAGFFLGLLESFATGFISSSYKDAVALLALLGVLFLRPSGIFGASSMLKSE